MAEETWDVKGKVCLITGGTAGIGAVTADELARRGGRVVLVGRSRERCEAAVARLRERHHAEADWIAADLSSQAEVRCLADEFRRRYDRLDVLVNNAGAMFLERRESVDGIEMTFALNHLSYFLLTNLLLDLLQAGAPARVVVVSSEAHRAGPLDFDDLQSTRRYKGFPAYCRSKLANLLFAFELARRLEGSGVTVNALHPGFVASNFFDGPGVSRWLIRRFAHLFGISPEQGARTSIYLASAPEVAEVTGRYFVKEAPAEPSPASRDREAAERLWRISEEMTSLAASRPSAV